MKILIISGTPKQDGICDSLVKAAASSAKDSGAEAEIIKLAEQNLERCRMCGDGWGTCREQRICEFDGNFNALQEKVREAGAFVYITPVYWSDVSEALKNYFDKLRRCQASKRWATGNLNNGAVGGIGGSYLFGKPSIIVASAGGGGGGIINTFKQMELAITHMGGDSGQRSKSGIYDYIAVNRWNQEYKRESLKAAVKSLINNMKS